MATQKQKAALQKMVENGGNVSKAMKEAGYTDSTSKNPSKLTSSKGFRELAAERGLTNELIFDALVEDIKAKKKNRIAELSLAAKITGASTDRLDITSDGESINNPYKSLTPEQLRKLAGE
jgi:hypothetical protein